MPVKRKPRNRITAHTNGKAKKESDVVEFVRRLTTNVEFSRMAMAQYMAGNGNPIDEACGYPIELQFADYKLAYERDGIANRIISFFPSECWSVQPWVYEREDMESDAQTPFEKKWIDLTETKGIYNKMYRFDEVSRIGHYGVLLVGDGGALESPVPTIDRNGKQIGTPKERELLYLMPFSEGEAQILENEQETNSLRYGKPIYYNLALANPAVRIPGMDSTQLKKVHWSRCVHLADGCTSNDNFGAPTLKKVFNYLINIRKILGGSAEMFLKGGFPGTAFVVPPELAASVELDKAALEKEIGEYYSGFKRYLALSGVVPQQLMPNIANPAMHMDVQLAAIAISTEIPKRSLMGSEEARLASMQDRDSINRRLRRRHEIHLTPNALRPVVDRFVMMGILPPPEKPVYHVKWPDVYAVSAAEKAEITGKLVRALAEYVKSGASKVFPPLQFFTMLMDLSTDEAETVISAAKEAIASKEYAFLDQVIDPIAKAKSQAADRRRASLGQTTKKVKIGTGTPKVSNNSVTVNPAMRCQRDGKPGFKYGEGGKCYTYMPDDPGSKKRALRKAKLQGSAIEIARHLQTMEKEDGDYEQ